MNEYLIKKILRFILSWAFLPITLLLIVANLVIWVFVDYNDLGMVGVCIENLTLGCLSIN